VGNVTAKSRPSQGNRLTRIEHMQAHLAPTSGSAHVSETAAACSAETELGLVRRLGVAAGSRAWASGRPATVERHTVLAEGVLGRLLGQVRGASRRSKPVVTKNWHGDDQAALE
jgi:hypothetical protein